MKGIIIKIFKEKESAHGGTYIRVFIKDISEKSESNIYTLDVWSKSDKALRFKPYLKPQAMFDKLELLMNKGKPVINANSDFIYLGIKQ